MPSDVDSRDIIMQFAFLVHYSLYSKMLDHHKDGEYFGDSILKFIDLPSYREVDVKLHGNTQMSSDVPYRFIDVSLLTSKRELHRMKLMKQYELLLDEYDILYIRTHNVDYCSSLKSCLQTITDWDDYIYDCFE